MGRIIISAVLKIIRRDQFLAPIISIAAGVGTSVHIRRGPQVVTPTRQTIGATASDSAYQPPQIKSQRGKS
ncbi:MAG: hypothetical protein A2Z59_07180 [Nitrospinae bacterium RIFCSPLOWO2_02_39_17]|nr:MAG: hypothetical protein A2W53_08040 [Nitrospinae bacterium RIFCSPHIGHO2_02_39_11]OGW04789.1 MAG: hypothetical protein A2Z59_07180 [Nitrospinae bacterium RIFCSPLOWO2_02_39_17]